ncbi:MULTISPECIES: restriction endonuclease subunit S [Pseudomonadati]|uniref:Restriction endonuclease subunit S n=1 Tax=Shewanella aestuarii TaxID=1028752 RepID=A0ABT0L3P1_9GAMM|nr:restriction endonuclease subunit S [Shewanella aestuarii]MCL1118320.1 restriction endonuclease subunit S [Shewanella aestuarii]GGN80492.1 hypothetical protein GCM10009193_25750 [Shewanella aestuarii]
MKLIALDAIAEIVRGITFSKADGSSTPEKDRLPVIRAGSIQSELLVDEGQIWVPKEKIKENQIIKKNDIIMCMSSGSSSLVGKCAKASEDWIGSFGAFCSGVRPDITKCVPSYLYYFLCTPTFRNWSGASDGANIKNIRASELAEFKIPLPPLETQKQIAAVLEKADQLRKDCQLMEQELNSLAQSVFIEMFGDPVTNPRGFDSKPLRELVSVLSGATPSKSNDNFWVGNVPWVSPKDMKVPELYDSIDHVNEIVFTETNLKKIPLNSILIVVRGMILVHTVPLAITRKNLSINQDIKALTVKCNSIKSEFLLAVLSSMHSHLLSIISTAAHGTKRIDMADLLGLKIIVPSIQQQDQFIKAVITMRNMTATQQAEATLYENNFNALMQKAFNGELNLDNANTQ